MAGLTLAPGETEPSRVTQVVRQLMSGKSNAIGMTTLNFGNGGILTLSGFTPGTNYLPGTYPGTALTGGFGAGATATIVVNGGGNVSSVTLVNPGAGYHAGDVLSAALPGGGGSGPIAALSVFIGGFGYTNGVHPGTILIGGSGAGATADVTVTANTLNSAVIANPGNNYAVADLLQPFGIGGAGGIISVDAISGSGFTATVGTVSGGTTTVVEAKNCSVTSIVLFAPMTANAAALMTGIYVKQSDIIKAQFTFTHANTPNSDCTFMWETRG